jgi:dTDP-4-amino-4,6-dideoxygalactose transaminase
MKSVIRISSPKFGIQEQIAVWKVLKSGKLSFGEKGLEFEDNFSKFIGVQYAIAVSSATSGLHLCLAAHEIKKGDEVIVPGFSFAATANVVALQGATPIFADIDPLTLNIDVNEIEEKITRRTRAIIVVHLYGLPANMKQIQVLAKKYGLIVIEDAAQAHGASIEGRMIGTFGDAAVFSFYNSKNMSTGEGGMITTSKPEIADKLKVLRNQGMESQYNYVEVGHNARLTDLQSAIGICQLKGLNQANAKRKKNADFYNRNLTNVLTQQVPLGHVHVYHQYSIRINSELRMDFMSSLSNLGIETRIYYPKPLSEIEIYKSKTYLPVCSKVSGEVVSIPVHSRLSKAQVRRISSSINQVIKRLTR